MTAPIIVIGSGMAGYQFIREYRKLNTQQPLLLISKDNARVYNKTQLSTAFAKNKTAEDLTSFSAAQMAHKLDFDVLTNSNVSQILPDKKQILVNGLVLTYKSLILALGASPNELKLEKATQAPIYNINSLQEFHEFQQQLSKNTSISVIGGGLIGCEYANDLTAAGYKVTLHCAQTSLLVKNIPKELGDALAQALTVQGAEVICNSLITHITQTAKNIELVNQKGQAYETDCVLSAIGLSPRTNLAKQAGLVVKTGIVVNEFLQTSNPDIYALGDCIEIDGEPQMYVMPLMQGAKVIAHKLNGLPSRYENRLIPVQVKTTALPIAFAGKPDKKDGFWQIIGKNPDYIAEFRTKNKKLYAYALTASQLMHKVALNKELLGSL